MKVNVKVLLENKNFTLEIDDYELIQSLSDMINAELKSTDDFYFIYNKAICATDKKLSELELIDDCTVYAAKKNDKPLKRKLEDVDLSDLLINGPSSKKLCAINGEDVEEHTVWQTKGLSEIQQHVNKVMVNDPFLFEPLILQSPIEEMIHNPSIINALYSANPLINDLIEKKPDQVKFFTDISQYDWIKNVMTDSNELERIELHYSENYKNILDSKRYKRMREIFEKADGVKPDESETLETPDYDEKNLGVFIKSQYAQNLSDLLAQDKDLSEKVLKSCPYGRNLSTENVSAIQNVLPQAMDNFKNALKLGNTASMYKYLRDNPIVVDEEVGKTLEEISGDVPETGDTADVTDCDNTKIYEMLGKINSWVNLTPTEDSTNKNYDKEVEMLNEMGFSDNGMNLQILASEYGSVNRAAIRLASQ